MKEGWVTKKLGEVCSTITRGIAPHYAESGDIVVLNQRCIREHRIDYSFARRHDSSAKNVPAPRKLQPGDILINSTGTGTLGRIAQVEPTLESFVTVDSHVTIARPAPQLFYAPFLKYAFMLIEPGLQAAGEGCGGQTELPRKKVAENFSLFFPISQHEQQRIVAILDSAFADIATAKAHAERNLANADSIFKSELNNLFSTSGKNWEPKKLKAITSKIGSGATPKGGKNSYITDGIPLVRSLNVHDGLFLFKNLAKLSHSQATALKNVTLHKNDILLNITGASIARCCILPNECVGGRVNQHVAIIRLNDSRILPAFLCYALICAHYKNKLLFIGDNAGSTRQALTKKDIEDFTISFPSFLNQQRIVARLDELSAHCKKLEALYRRKIALYDELKQSLLAKAFRGELC